MVRLKKRALAKRSALADRIKSIFDLGVSSETDLGARQRFLIAVNDLSDLWDKFLIENDAVLEALIELGEDQEFSSAEELEANKMLVSAKALASRFSSLSISEEQLVPEGKDSSEGAGDSVATTRPVEPQFRPVSVGQLSHSIRLPEIPLPRFSGELVDWPDFRDRFIALMDSRSSISNIEKFYYLLSCLELEASEVVKGITVSNNTYPLAWAALVERFDKPRKLATSLVESMLAAPVIPDESVAALNKFLNTFDENVTILEALNIPDLGDFVVFTLAFRSLPISSRRLFEMANLEEYPRTRDLFKFIKGRVQVLEMAGGSPSSLAGTNLLPKLHKHSKERVKTKKLPTSLLVTQVTEAPSVNRNKCVACKEYHPLSKCSVFKGLTVDGRFNLVSKHRLCMSCFSDQHWSNKCQERCSKCSRRHHILIHRDNKSSQDRVTAGSSAVLLGMQPTQAVLFGTALVLVRDVGGSLHPIRALIDSGSQICAITKRVSDRLGLRRSRWTASITGISGHCVSEVTGTVQLDVQSQHDAA